MLNKIATQKKVSPIMKRKQSIEADAGSNYIYVGVMRKII